MAAKAHLRNEKPLVISISTNDALGMNFKNIGTLMNIKNIYFVPFGQDNYEKKHHSMIAHVERYRIQLKRLCRESRYSRSSLRRFDREINRKINPKRVAKNKKCPGQSVSVRSLKNVRLTL